MAARIRRSAFAVLVLASIVSAAAKPECWVIDSRGKKHKGIHVQIKNPQGDLELIVDGRVRLPFKAGSYRAAFVPKPKEVAQLEEQYKKEKYTAVVQQADALFNTYKFVGWGDGIAAMKGMSLLQLQRPKEALAAFAWGQRYPGRYRDVILRGTVLAMLDMKTPEKAEPLLAKMITSSKPANAAFAFNARGRILEDAGKSKEAVLEYLIVLLFFKDNASVREYREEARTHAVALMKEMHDQRWRRIAEIK